MARIVIEIPKGESPALWQLEIQRAMQLSGTRIAEIARLSGPDEAYWKQIVVRCAMIAEHVTVED